MSHDENGAPGVYEQLALLRRSLTLLTAELERAVAERDDLRTEVAHLRRQLALRETLEGRE